jgi:hypothetical protein
MSLRSTLEPTSYARELAHAHNLSRSIGSPLDESGLSGSERERTPEPAPVVVVERVSRTPPPGQFELEKSLKEVADRLAELAATDATIAETLARQGVASPVYSTTYVHRGCRPSTAPERGRPDLNSFFNRGGRQVICVDFPTVALQ